MLARVVASCSRPVFTGIGHQVDRSVADEAAHTCCATPTAAAAAVVETATRWLDRLERLGQDIGARSRQGSATAQRLTDNASKRLIRRARAVQCHYRTRLER